MNSFKCPDCKEEIETAYSDQTLVNSTMDCPNCEETLYFQLTPVNMNNRMREIYLQYLREVKV